MEFSDRELNHLSNSLSGRSVLLEWRLGQRGAASDDEIRAEVRELRALQRRVDHRLAERGSDAVDDHLSHA